MGFTNNKTDKILEFKNQGIKAAAGTVQISPCDLHGVLIVRKLGGDDNRLPLLL